MRYINQYRNFNIGNFWNNISTSILNNSISHNPPSLNPNAVSFTSNGLRMITFTNTTLNLYQWTLSTAWDISTATYDSVSKLISGNFSTFDMKMTLDGTKIYISHYSPDKIDRYALSTPYDITTMVLDQTLTLTNNPRSFVIKDDGTKIMILYESINQIHQYNLTTPYDLTTISALITSLDYSLLGQCITMEVKQIDGLRLFITNNSGARYVHQFSGTIGWDLSTFSNDNESYATGGETTPRGLFFKPDGSKWYQAGVTLDTIREYNL